MMGRAKPWCITHDGVVLARFESRLECRIRRNQLWGTIRAGHHRILRPEDVPNLHDLQITHEETLT